MHSNFKTIFLSLLFVISILISNGSDAVNNIRQMIQIDSGYHPLSEPLIAIQDIPKTATIENPAPLCLVFHGSGGLFKEGVVGESCDTQPENLENNYHNLIDLLSQNQVASLATSSFASRDSRFCEDNDDNYFQFVAPPFHNDGDGLPLRDKFYKIRRILTRTLDAYATINYACSLPEIDCNNICMIGTSNGASTIMSYVANDIGRHVKEYSEINIQREFESNSAFSDRQIAFANYPALNNDIDSVLNVAPQPKFVYAISPGCSLRSLVPTVAPDDEDFNSDLNLYDLFYPNPVTTLNIEIGSLDDVPDQCHSDGIRLQQAIAYEYFENILDPRYLLNFHQGHDHDLLNEVGETIHQDIKESIITHFFLIFKNSFD
jgi:hypothetical protein